MKTTAGDEEIRLIRNKRPEGNSKESLIREWVVAVGYATLDGSPHALRLAMLKYVKLPPMLPHLGPNDEPDDLKPRWLFDAARSVDQILRYKRMPETEIEEVPDVAGMSM